MKARLVFCVAAFSGVTVLVDAADWPTYRFDARRSGVTTDRLDLPLRTSWEFRSALPPSPAWPDPARQNYLGGKYNLKPRNVDDRAYQPVIANGLVYFGSSSDDKVYCLDAMTGAIRWTYFTAGPVRYAPVVSAGRVLVGSDDGWVYCLDARAGNLLWKYSPREDHRLLANDGALISTVPVRTGLVVRGGDVFFASGHFPLEGTYQVALRVQDGSVVWQQTGGIAAQGYLLASPAQLIVPTGRTSPALLDAQSGRFIKKTRTRSGGTFALLTDDLLVTGPGDVEEGSLTALRGKDRVSLVSFPGRHLVAHRGAFFLQGKGHIAATDARKLREPKKKPQAPYTGPEWKLPCAETFSMILAGDHLITGEANKVVVRSSADGKTVWSHEVEGLVYGLAVSDGGLFVSSDRGMLYRFGKTRAAETVVQEKTRTDDKAELARRTAKLLVDNAPLKKGYCLVLGLGDGSLVEPIAAASQLHVIGVDPDPEKVDRARRALDARRSYGGRVRIHRGDYYRLAYSDYLISLLVVPPSPRPGRRLGKDRDSIERLFGLLRPLGGSAMVYLDDSASADDVVAAWRDAGAVSRHELVPVDGGDGAWLRIERDRIYGAADWTHMYAEPGNTTYSGDQQVGGDMELLWFGRPGPRDVVNRHHHPTAPLAVDGRLFIPANERIIALDLYSGVLHWTTELAHPPRLRADLTGNIFVAGKDTLYMAVGDKCLRWDMATGRPKRSFELPQLVEGTEYEWGYTALVDDLLIGTGQKPAAAFRKFTGKGVAIATWSPPEHVTSDYLFAVDRYRGELRWSHATGVIANSAIAVGEGRVFLVESRSPQVAENPSGKVALQDLVAGGNARLLALDLATGETVWEARPELGDLQRIIFLSYSEGVVLITGSFVRNRRSMHLLSAFDARTGRNLWSLDRSTLFSDVNSGHGELQRHPAIVKGVVYADPWAYNLHTGRKVEGWHFKRGGHGCGPVTASANALYGRAGTHGRYDLDAGGEGSKLSLVSRAGCWVHMLPVGGVLAVPESSSGCTCDYIVQTSMAFKPVARTPRTARKQATTINENAFSLDAKHWRVHDSSGANPAESDWRVEGHVVSEHSNIARGSGDDPEPGSERPGTLRIFLPPDGLNYSADAPAARSDSRFSLEIQEGDTVESFSVPMAPTIAGLTQGDLTLHTWFKTHDAGRSILMGNCCGSNPRALNFELHTGNKLRLWIHGPAATTDLNVPLADVGNSRDGKWHAASAVRRGESVELFFDGVRVAQAEDIAGSFSQAPARYYFGRDERVGSERFSGKLDDVALWGEALTTEQITKLAKGASPRSPDLPRPVAYFAFETTGGEAVSDRQSGVGRVDDSAGHGEGPFPGHGEGAPPQGELAFADGELSLELASDDDDVFGVAFRLRDPEHYYLFAMDRQRGFRILAVKDGDDYRLLDFNEKDYRTFHWYRTAIVLEGPKITVYVDGDKELEVVDDTFSAGTFALYAWGCAGAKFRNVVWSKAE